MLSNQTELVFGFVYAVGTNPDPVASLLKDYLKQFGYETNEFRISEHLRTLELGISFDRLSTNAEINALMTAGDRARDLARADDILAVMAVNDIVDKRNGEQPGKIAHLIRSLKTPDEVRLLRDVYRPGFFLIGIASDDDEQRQYLKNVRGLSNDEAEKVVKRDQDEQLTYGQRTRNTFYLADVFVELTGERYKQQLERFVELVFGHPFRTPTREEHAMFMAYGSAARSAQLSRQVGAAITTVDGDVVAVGFNEVPSASGGQYWDGDPLDARDHVYDQKTDSNYLQRLRIVTSIVENLKDVLLTEENARRLLRKIEMEGKDSQIDERMTLISDMVASDYEINSAVHSSELKEITEYGRAVHAEMDALLTCARLGISVKGKQLFTTTFPCHTCTRHIIAAGLCSVTYIEPYPKSRAADLHRDAVCFDADEAKTTRKIPFLPFVGVGPRRYLDLFSLELSTGAKVKRKEEDGKACFPGRASRLPRVAMLPLNYLERENKLLEEYKDVITKLEGK